MHPASGIAQKDGHVAIHVWRPLLTRAWGHSVRESDRQVNGSSWCVDLLSVRGIGFDAGIAEQLETFQTETRVPAQLLAGLGVWWRWVEVRALALGSEARFTQPRRNRMRLLRKGFKGERGIVPLQESGGPACCWARALAAWKSTLQAFESPRRVAQGCGFWRIWVWTLGTLGG